MDCDHCQIGDFYSMLSNPCPWSPILFYFLSFYVGVGPYFVSPCSPHGFIPMANGSPVPPFEDHAEDEEYRNFLLMSPAPKDPKLSGLDAAFLRARRAFPPTPHSRSKCHPFSHINLLFFLAPRYLRLSGSVSRIDFCHFSFGCLAPM